jgi:hypothetical protein
MVSLHAHKTWVGGGGGTGMARAVAVSINIRRGTIAAMLNEVSGMPVSEPPPNRRPWCRFRPHPASAVVWLYALLLVWYAAPRGSFFPEPGMVITAHYPQVLEYGKMLLAAYWVCAAVAFGIGSLHRRQPSLLRTLEVVLAVLVAVFGGAYAAARLGGPAVLDVALMVALVTFVPAFVIAGALTSPKHPRSALVPLALSLLVVFPLAWPQEPALSGTWQDLARVKAPDGYTYHLQLKQAMQGRDYALTIETEGGPLFLRTRVLADRVLGESDSLGVSPGWPILIHPSGVRLHPTGRAFLVTSHDSQWVSYVTSNEGTWSVCFAYDLTAKRLYRGDDRAQLSPFLLIGPDDELDPHDVSTLRTRVPGPEVLERDAHHPNPRVRALVRELRAGR